jgi:hypothetical protein
MRAGILVLLGGLAVHELRYALTGRHQDQHAHAYMGWLVPVVGALAVLAAVEFAARLAGRARSGPHPLSAAGVRWLALSSLLVAIFAVQETGEMLLAHGHVAIADSLVAHGGWMALPLSFAVGAVIALLLRGARALLARAWGRRPKVRAAAPAPLRRRPDRGRPRIAVIACHLAGRAPPSFVS